MSSDSLGIKSICLFFLLLLLLQIIIYLKLCTTETFTPQIFWKIPFKIFSFSMTLWTSARAADALKSSQQFVAETTLSRLSPEERLLSDIPRHVHVWTFIVVLADDNRWSQVWVKHKNTVCLWRLVGSFYYNLQHVCVGLYGAVKVSNPAPQDSLPATSQEIFMSYYIRVLICSDLVTHLLL